MHIHQEINTLFPVRNTNGQKEAFRTWLGEKCGTLGYNACVEQTDKKGKTNNVIVGDAAHAQVIFIAHYDTPQRALIPNLMMPRNLLASYAYVFLIVGPLLMLAFGAQYLVDELLGVPALGLVAYFIIYFGAFMLLIMGPKSNPHNANDNTSGCAVLLHMMETMDVGDREKVAFIFFDNEEKGLMGSSGYAKLHPAIKKNTLVVNMDCVANGDHLLLIGKKKAMEDEKYALLRESAPETEKYSVHFFGKKGSRMNSDHARFDKGIGVCACKKVPVLGFTCGRIHTPKDTLADTENVDYLTAWMNAFVKKLM